MHTKINASTWSPIWKFGTLMVCMFTKPRDETHTWHITRWEAKSVKSESNTQRQSVVIHGAYGPARPGYSQQSARPQTSTWPPPAGRHFSAPLREHRHTEAQPQNDILDFDLSLTCLCLWKKSSDNFTKENDTIKNQTIVCTLWLIDR